MAAHLDTITGLDLIAAADGDATLLVSTEAPDHGHLMRKREGREVSHSMVPVHSTADRGGPGRMALDSRDLPFGAAEQEAMHRKIVSIPFQILDPTEIDRRPPHIVSVTTKSIGPGMQEWHATRLGGFHERGQRERKDQALGPPEFEGDEIHPRRRHHDGGDSSVLESPAFGPIFNGRASIESHR